MDRARSIDITVGSLANALGSSGGFVLGDHVMSQHQHIGSNAYCFSASLPAYTTTTATETLKMLAEDNSAVQKVHGLSRQLFDFFNNDKDLMAYVQVKSSVHSLFCIWSCWMISEWTSSVITKINFSKL